MAYTLINNPSLIKTRYHKKEEEVVKKSRFPTHILPHFMYETKSQVKAMAIRMSHNLSLSRSSNVADRMEIDDNIKMTSYKEEEEELNLALSSELPSTTTNDNC